jgi:hypothetical protein
MCSGRVSSSHSITLKLNKNTKMVNTRELLTWISPWQIGKFHKQKKTQTILYIKKHCLTQLPGRMMSTILCLYIFFLSMQSVSITTNVVSSNPLMRGVLGTTLCDKFCQWLVTGQWFNNGYYSLFLQLNFLRPTFMKNRYFQLLTRQRHLQHLIMSNIF